jgi:hypothetical protein
MFPWAAYGRTTLAGGSVVRKLVATKTRPWLGGPTSHGVILSTPPEPRTDSSVKGQTGRSTENLLSDFRETFMPEVGFPRMQFVGDSFVAVCGGKRLAVAYPRRLLLRGGDKQGSKRGTRLHDTPKSVRQKLRRRWVRRMRELPIDGDGVGYYSCARCLGKGARDKHEYPITKAAAPPPRIAGTTRRSGRGVRLGVRPRGGGRLRVTGRPVRAERSGTSSAGRRR